MINQVAMEPLCRIRDIFRSINDFENQFQEKYGICLNEGMLLCTISKIGKCSSGKIADELGLTSSNASKVIVSMEKKGLIERIVGEEDRRQMHFILTEKGRKSLESFKCDSEEILSVIERIKEM